MRKRDARRDTRQRQFRAVCWTAVAGTVWFATQPATDPASARIGLLLGATLAVALRLTGRDNRNHHRNAARNGRDRKAKKS